MDDTAVHQDSGEPEPPDAAAQALERLTEGVYSLGPDGTVLYANAPALRMAQRSLEEVRGRSVWDIFPFLRATTFSEHYDHAVSSGEITEFEDFTPVVGRWLWRRFYPRPDGVTVLMGERGLPTAGTEAGIEQQRLLDRSRTSEQRYRELLDGMAEGVVETTVGGEFVTANRAFARMLGYASADDLLTRVPHVADLYVTPSQRRPALEQIDSGNVEPVEVELHHVDGGTIWVRARAWPKHAVTGELVGVQSVVEDVTQLRAADRFLQENEDRIAERERTLIAEAVHDEPLQLIVAGILRLDSMQEQLPSGAHAPLAQVAELLQEAVEGLRHLITTTSPPDLSHGLGPALRVLAEGIFAGTATRIELVGPPHVPLQIETKWQAFRILREALINARKHAAATTVTITLQPSAGAVVLSVADDGVGAASPTTEPGHLGMATMQARATSLRGTLETMSPRGGGTVVELRLPQDLHA